MSRSVQKQLLINQLGVNLYLSDDLVTIIKDYCFYDTKSYNTIKNIKLKKTEINNIVKKVLIYYNFMNDELFHHRWGVVMYTLDDQFPTLFLDNTMCNSCGNYIYNTYQLNIPRKITCNCY